MCKADAAELCVMCDSDIHLANPIAHRHDRVPVEPFFAPPSRSSNRTLRRVDHQINWMKLGLLGGMKLGFIGLDEVGFIRWGFGEAAVTRERVAATEDEVLWPCG